MAKNQIESSPKGKRRTQMPDDQPSNKRQKRVIVEEEIKDDITDESRSSHSGAESSHSVEGQSHVDAGRGELKAHDSKNIRFGSEENDSDIQNLHEKEAGSGSTKSESRSNSSQNEDSEDDAPEAFSKSDAQSRAKGALAEAAKRVEKQRSTDKQRRKERDARLKRQSKQSHQSDQKVRAPKSLQGGKSAKSLGLKLPQLLPEEILADESFNRPPTPEQEANRRDISATPLKRSKSASQSKRNLQVGSINVSVLDKQNPFLAPKSNRDSRSLKENWLAGRKGRTFERKKINRGFLKV